MKKPNDLWVPKSKRERIVVVVITWTLAVLLVTLSNENETISGIAGIFAIIITIYTLTQGTEELKKEDAINKVKRKEKRERERPIKEARRKERREQQIKIQAANRSIKKGRHPETGEVVCPKCGSLQLSANKKGLSFWTGIIGSQKVRITCMRCGNRWKAGKYK